MSWFRRTRPQHAPRVEPTISTPDKRDMKISAFALDSFQSGSETAFQPAKPLPGVVPENATPLAMDAGTNSLYSYAAINSHGSEISFPGFPLLAELAQRPEYRHLTDTLAREMTRKWGTLVASGDEDKSDKIARLTELVEQHNLQDKFRVAATHDGLFGRGHIFIEIDGKRLGDDDLDTPLLLTSNTIRKGAKIRFSNVEPIWTYPNDYNANDPLHPDFYVPQTWWVMGKSVHRSRLLTFVGRPLPDILKPAYGFAGMSMSQMAIPYVQNWLRTRQSVSDLLHSFSVMVLKTVMGVVLQGGGGDTLVARAQLFNQARDNRGLMMIDKETEELGNVSAPIAGLDKLQAQAQEQMASVATQPLIKLLGITPSGLNASSDGEIRSWYDNVAAAQGALFDPNFKACLNALQLVEFGEIDPAITQEWTPLWQLDEAGEAAVRKTDADTAAVYIEAGVLAPEEQRQRLASNPGSGYNNIDPDDVPEPPMGAEPDTSDPETNKIDKEAEAQGGVTSGV